MAAEESMIQAMEIYNEINPNDVRSSENIVVEHLESLYTYDIL